MKLVNGVFKGGGAKGIAYAGALPALRDRGLWFGSVARASAGAITAALIAAGLAADGLEDAVPKALDAVKASAPKRVFSATTIGIVSLLLGFGRLILGTIIPSARAAIGVPTKVPPWTGLGEDAVVLRVLTTVSRQQTSWSIRPSASWPSRRLTTQLHRNWTGPRSCSALSTS